MVTHVVHSTSLASVNALRPLDAPNADGERLPTQPAWSADFLNTVTKGITAYFECVTRKNAAHDSRTDRKLLVVKFTSAGLDKASLGRILNEPEIVACIPSEYRKLIGKPLVCYKYSMPIGKLWHNTKHYANMSQAELERIRDTPCDCASISACHKICGHLLTSDPGILPRDNDCKLAHICELGAKFRPNSAQGVFDSNTKLEIAQSLKGAVDTFAMKGELRSRSGCMHDWRMAVHTRLDSVLNAIPDGTPMQPMNSLTYTPSDEATMRRFLRGKVCTSMDKAATTTVFWCQKDYVTKVLADLGASAEAVLLEAVHAGKRTVWCMQPAQHHVAHQHTQCLGDACASLTNA